jgi:hypothetical protein
MVHAYKTFSPRSESRVRAAGRKKKSMKTSVFFFAFYFFLVGIARTKGSSFRKQEKKDNFVFHDFILLFLCFDR